MSITISPTRTASRANRSGANTAPVNFDPATHPIIARHWFGIEPLRLHWLGPPVLAELLAKVAAERSITTGIERRALDALGGG